MEKGVPAQVSFNLISIVEANGFHYYAVNAACPSSRPSWRPVNLPGRNWCRSSLLRSGQHYSGLPLEIRFLEIGADQDRFFQVGFFNSSTAHIGVRQIRSG